MEIITIASWVKSDDMPNLSILAISFDGIRYVIFNLNVLDLKRYATCSTNVINCPRKVANAAPSNLIRKELQTFSSVCRLSQRLKNYFWLFLP